MADVHVGGASHTKKVGEETHRSSVATVRFSTGANLDVLVEADGTKSVLTMLKLIAQEITDLEAPSPLPAEWNELVSVPSSGTQVTITFGIRTEYSEEE